VSSLEYDLPDAAGSAVRADMKRIKPDVAVLLCTAIGSQTPFLLRFLDAYLQSPARLESDLRDLDRTVGNKLGGGSIRSRGDSILVKI